MDPEFPVRMETNAARLPRRGRIMWDCHGNEDAFYCTAVDAAAPVAKNNRSSVSFKSHSLDNVKLGTSFDVPRVIIDMYLLDVV